MRFGQQRFAIPANTRGNGGMGDVTSSLDSLTTTLGTFGTWLSDEMITGIPNYALLVGGYLVYSLFSSASSGISKYSRGRASARSKSAKSKAAALRAEAKSLEAF
jgi:hypothetical protein